MDEGTPVTLVSRDMVARIRAQMMEVPAEDFTTDRLPDGAQPYTGRTEVYIPDGLLTTFKKKGAPAEELYTVDGAGERRPVSLTENQWPAEVQATYITGKTAPVAVVWNTVPAKAPGWA